MQILLENKDFIAVDKPAGLSVHNAEGGENLLELLERQLKRHKLFPVHRLDKETSGVQILALNEKSARELAEEFQKRTVGKFYRGILRGELKTPEGIWNFPLTDKSEGRRNPAGIARDRLACETAFKVIKSSRYFTECEFQLFTGRQHQIRKHTAIAGHALVGDPRYGDPKYNQKIAELYKNARMFLHCARIEVLSFQIESPLPRDFRLA